MLGSGRWLLGADVSEQPIGSLNMDLIGCNGKEFLESVQYFCIPQTEKDFFIGEKANVI